MQTSIYGTVRRPRGRRGAVKWCSLPCGLETRLGWQLPRRAGACLHSSSVLAVPVSFWALVPNVGGPPENTVPLRCGGRQLGGAPTPLLGFAA